MYLKINKYYNESFTCKNIQTEKRTKLADLNECKGSKLMNKKIYTVKIDKNK